MSNPLTVAGFRYSTAVILLLDNEAVPLGELLWPEKVRIL